MYFTALSQWLPFISPFTNLAVGVRPGAVRRAPRASGARSVFPWDGAVAGHCCQRVPAPLWGVTAGGGDFSASVSVSPTGVSGRKTVISYFQRPLWMASKQREREIVTDALTATGPRRRTPSSQWPHLTIISTPLRVGHSNLPFLSKLRHQNKRVRAWLELTSFWSWIVHEMMYLFGE